MCFTGQVERFISDSSNDEESLVPASSDDADGSSDDDSSYVIQSAPNSDGTFATTRSIDDDTVLVDSRKDRGEQ